MQKNGWDQKKIALAEKRIYFDDTLQFGAQNFSEAASDEISRCKSCRGQGMNRARNNPSIEIGKSQEQEGGYPGSTRRQQESPLCHIDGHISFQECGVGTQIAEVQRQSRDLGVTL